MLIYNKISITINNFFYNIFKCLKDLYNINKKNLPFNNISFIIIFKDFT